MHEGARYKVFEPRGASRGYVMMVVEDDSTARAELRTPLLDDGFGVIEVDDGRQAIEVIHTGDNPLVVEAAVINVDRSDGMEAMSYFKKEFPSMALIAMAGSPTSNMTATPRMKIGILGAGKGGGALLGLFGHLPEVEVAGINDKDPNAPGLRQARDLGIPVVQDPVRLITSEDIHLLVDVTGDPDMERLIAGRKKPGTEVLGGAAAKLLWTLVQYESQMRAHLARNEKLSDLVRQGVMSDYLVKPIKAEPLLHALANALEHKPAVH